MSDSDVVIRVEGLGKKYTIKHEQPERYRTLKESISHRTTAIARWANPFTLAGQIRRAKRHAAHEQSSGEEDFWALKDVSIEIRRGERVGIIGRNGAGKSTLLKILSRITEPTTGRVEIRGRVASLLEVGTGFHPELTGRENIYLNGAILGMSRREMRSKFDEIVAFAEVERFLDTPVKRYSSGMYVRLAFAVAAHLEPEILVVDEVLAVGDASFQKKCLGKMEDVADREGRTILFVSHQLAPIKNLCTRGVLLDRGNLAFLGSSHEAIEKYLGSENRQTELALWSRKDRKGSGQAVFVEATIGTTTGGTVKSGDDVIVSLKIRNKSKAVIKDVVFSIDICDKAGNILLMQRSDFQQRFFTINPELNEIRCMISKLPLVAGTFEVNLFMGIHDIYPIDWIESAVTLVVEDGNFFGSGVNGRPSHCKILNEHYWCT